MQRSESTLSLQSPFFVYKTAKPGINHTPFCSGHVNFLNPAFEVYIHFSFRLCRTVKLQTCPLIQPPAPTLRALIIQNSRSMQYFRDD